MKCKKVNNLIVCKIVKRYFDLPDERLVAEIEVDKGSKAETASTEQIKKAMNWDEYRVEKVDRATYNALKKKF